MAVATAATAVERHRGSAAGQELRRRSFGTLANGQLVSKLQQQPLLSTQATNNSSSQGKGKCVGHHHQSHRKLKVTQNQSRRRYYDSGKKRSLDSWKVILEETSTNVRKTNRLPCQIILVQAVARMTTMTTAMMTIAGL
jgi:hypothetical protein